jgi:hypothetical protein
MTKGRSSTAPLLQDMRFRGSVNRMRRLDANDPSRLWPVGTVVRDSWPFVRLPEFMCCGVVVGYSLNSLIVCWMPNNRTWHVSNRFPSECVAVRLPGPMHSGLNTAPIPDLGSGAPLSRCRRPRPRRAAGST